MISIVNILLTVWTYLFKVVCPLFKLFVSLPKCLNWETFQSLLEIMEVTDDNIWICLQHLWQFCCPWQLWIEGKQIFFFKWESGVIFKLFQFLKILALPLIYEELWGILCGLDWKRRHFLTSTNKQSPMDRHFPQSLPETRFFHLQYGF